jgi:hypothetical protein
MDEPILVGSRERFGVEIDVRSRVPGIWACVTLWIGGESLGNKDESVALYALMGALDGMLRGVKDPAASDLLVLPTCALWEHLRTDAERHHVPSTEFFDDYEMYCVSDEQVARFLWTSRRRESSDLYDVSVSRSDVQRSLRDLHAVYAAIQT